MKYVLIIFIFLLYACDGVEVAKTPKMNVDDKLIFSDSDLLEIGDEAQKNIKITNIGKGQLIITSISLLENSDFSIGTYKVSNRDSSSFPFTLRHDDFLEVEIKIKASEEGGKSTKLLIESNDLKEPKKTIDISASNFKPVLEVRYNSIAVEDLTVNKCEGIDLSKGTLIDLCNIGKASLIIKNIELDGGNFKIEEINFPAKLKVSAHIKTCVKKLSICNAGKSGEEGTIKVKTNEDILHRINLTGK